MYKTVRAHTSALVCIKIWKIVDFHWSNGRNDVSSAARNEAFEAVFIILCRGAISRYGARLPAWGLGATVPVL